MNSKFVATILLVLGLGTWGYFNFVEPITMDNMRWHLNATGLAAVLIGLGLSPFLYKRR